MAPAHSSRQNSDLLPTLPVAGFMRLPQVLQVIPVGRSTWWAGVRSGRFPQPVKLGPRTTAWRVDDIREFVSSRQA